MIKKGLTVLLSHAANDDISDLGGYWSRRTRDRKKVVSVKDLAEASAICRDYIERNDLGGGNWTGGLVSKDGKPFATVSYNGRVWAGFGIRPVARQLKDKLLYAPKSNEPL